MSANDAIQQLTEAISAFPGVEKIILYGSRARGDNTPFSDIDIAVSGNIDGAAWSRIRRLADVEDNTVKTLLKIDIARLEPAGADLRESIMREGKILYERG